MLVHQALSVGVPPRDLLRDVLVRAQREVGLLWERGDISVAQEHAATAVADRVLLLISSGIRRPASEAVLTVVCPEEEWHAMPARLAAEIARTGGLSVRVLGANVSADHLYRHLLAEPPAALAVSTTMTANLVGASRCIDVAHRAGVPVIVGGAAWGSGTAQAAALGADVKLDDPADLPEVVHALARSTVLGPQPGAVP